LFVKSYGYADLLYFVGWSC